MAQGKPRTHTKWEETEGKDAFHYANLAFMHALQQLILCLKCDLSFPVWQGIALSVGAWRHMHLVPDRGCAWGKAYDSGTGQLQASLADKMVLCKPVVGE